MWFTYYLIFNFTYFSTSYICYILDTRYFDKVKPYYYQNKTLDKLKKSYIQILPEILFSNLVISVPFFYVVNKFLAPQERSIVLSIIQLMFYRFINDIYFYIFHRLFHKVPFLYQNIHKLHHKYAAPIGIAALYAHPIENYAVNLMSVIIGPIIWSPNIFILCFWIILSTTNSVLLSHSGISLRKFTPTFKMFHSMHDLHHARLNVNFGVTGMMDRLFGTYLDDN